MLHRLSLSYFLLAALVFIISFFAFGIAPASAYACTPTLTEGSQGPEVGCLQQLLTITGDYHYGEITNYFGPATEQAVQSFQSRNNIVKSGTPETTGYGSFGPSTQKSLFTKVLTILIGRLNVAGLYTNDLPKSDTPPGGDLYTNELPKQDPPADDSYTGDPPKQDPPQDSGTGALTIKLLPDTDELVWQGKNNCIIPDGPFQMWKNSNDVAIGIISLPYDYILSSKVKGGAFEISPTQVPRLVFRSPQRQLQSFYDSKMWMMGFWTDNGKDVYAVAHHEWYPSSLYRTYTGDPSEGCSTGGIVDGKKANTSGWVTNIHHLTSHNGGLSFNTTVPLDTSKPSNSSRLAIVTEPYGPDKPVYPDGVVRYGFFHPSNIVKEGEYYYFTVGVQEIIEDASGNDLIPRRQGLALVRTSDISEPRSGSTYQYWNGDGWTSIKNYVANGAPFIYTHQADAANSEQVGGAITSIHPLSFSLKYSTEHKEWVMLGYSRTRELSYLTTPTLSNPKVSDLQVVEGSVGKGPNSDTWFASYPTIIDPDSAGYVFQNVDSDAYLYYLDGKGGYRDIRRMKVEIQ